MNKQKFLKELEKKLEILSETEREDTINEYRDIIEEKVKHGKTEEEAVKEFGSIDELTKEILSAYKINPEYQNRTNESKDSAKDFVETTENLIKKGANKVSEMANDVVESIKKSDVSLTTEKAFEIIIKVIFLLLGLAILKIPFYCVSKVGSHIFTMDFVPFSWTLRHIWEILIEIVYFIACILIIVTFVKKYIKVEEQEEVVQPKSKKVNTKAETRTETKVKNESFKEEKKPKRNADKTGSLGIILLTIVKVWICIFVLFPIYCINIAIMIGLAFVIYFICKGVYMIGVLILVVGILTIGLEICHAIHNILFATKKYHFAPLIVGFGMTLIGLIFTIDYFMGFTFYNKLPNDQFEVKTVTLEETITVPTVMLHYNVEFVLDNSLADSQVKVKINYYDDRGDASIRKETHQWDNIDGTDYGIYYRLDRNDNSFNWNRDINEKLINQLKKKEIYDYSLLDEIKIKVYANETTRDLIK